MSEVRVFMSPSWLTEILICKSEILRYWYSSSGLYDSITIKMHMDFKSVERIHCNKQFSVPTQILTQTLTIATLGFCGLQLRRLNDTDIYNKLFCSRFYCSPVGKFARFLSLPNSSTSHPTILLIYTAQETVTAILATDKLVAWHVFPSPRSRGRCCLFHCSLPASSLTSVIICFLSKCCIFCVLHLKDLHKTAPSSPSASWVTSACQPGLPASG